MNFAFTLAYEIFTSVVGKNRKDELGNRIKELLGNASRQADAKKRVEEELRTMTMTQKEEVKKDVDEKHNDDVNVEVMNHGENH